MATLELEDGLGILEMEDGSPWEIEGTSPIQGQATITGAATLTVTARKITRGQATLAGSATVAITGRKIARASATLTGAATLTATGRNPTASAELPELAFAAAEDRVRFAVATPVVT